MPSTGSYLAVLRVLTEEPELGVNIEKSPTTYRSFLPGGTTRLCAGISRAQPCSDLQESTRAEGLGLREALGVEEGLALVVRVEVVLGLCEGVQLPLLLGLGEGEGLKNAASGKPARPEAGSPVPVKLNAPPANRSPLPRARLYTGPPVSP